MDKLPVVLDKLAVGLSRALRYSYGGVLLGLGWFALSGEGLTGPWPLVALSALLLGTGFYAVHRSVVIPIHHLLLCFSIFAWEKIIRLSPRLSGSPTRWLGSIGVPWSRRMLAYTTLRRYFFKEKERETLDIAHAESGLVIMTAEALLVASWYGKGSEMTGWQVLLMASLLFFLAPFPAAWGQHSLECMRFRAGEQRARQILGGSGFRLGRKGTDGSLLEGVPGWKWRTEDGHGRSALPLRNTIVVFVVGLIVVVASGFFLRLLWSQRIPSVKRPPNGVSVVSCDSGFALQANTRFYFGLRQPGGAVTTSEFNDFLNTVVTPHFPHGLTAWESEGQWRGSSDSLVREPSMVVELVHEATPTAEASAREVARLYRQRFHQDSVLRVTDAVCVGP